MRQVFTLKAVLAWVILAFALSAAPAFAQVSVNGTAVSAQQISARAGLLRLEGRGSSNSARLQMATDELIDDTLKLLEAQRLGITVSEDRVNAAVQSIAQGMRVSTSNLERIFTENGVPFSTLRDRLRAALAWQAVVQQVVSSRVQISELELDLRAEQQVEEIQNFDYILREVIFVGGNASRRTAEANQYRTRFTGCDAAVDLVLEFPDAAVRDIGRRHGTQLPEAIATELAGLNAGQITRPRVTEYGVSMYAICEKASARDLTFIRDELRQEVGTEALQEEAEAYLANLRAQADIRR